MCDAKKCCSGSAASSAQSATVAKCEPPASKCCTSNSTDVDMASTIEDDPAAVRASVQTYYGKVLSKTSDLKTSACTTGCGPPSALRPFLKNVPAPVMERFYGCGAPLPMGITGMRVLDLGSGSGRDVYVAAALVGETGHVVGVDMTDEQLAIAREHADSYCTATLGYAGCNMTFTKGLIEKLVPDCVEKASMDLVISNCVVNLSPQKHLVLQGVYDALRVGGEFYFSDVYADRRLPKEVRQNELLLGECIGGALYVGDFVQLCREVGFSAPRVLTSSAIKVEDPTLLALTKDALFFSITYRVFKLDTLEPAEEDYGQKAVYKGTIPGSADVYELDEEHRFVTGISLAVSSNTAAILAESWLRPHFTVIGDRSSHKGAFRPVPVPQRAGSGCGPVGCC